MGRRFHLLWMLSMCGPVCFSLLVVSSRASAQSKPATAAAVPAPTSTSGTQALVAERQRLRVELSRVQTDIDQLKKGDRGLRADYQLRARQADAEAIARRLTDLDEQLRVQSPGAAPRPLAPIGDEPVASPTDGPQELDAKADILSDQAHRVQTQAVALKTRIDQVRGRRELRRRAHQLDSDPFAPLEGSKRRLLTGGGSTPARPGDAQNGTPSSDSAGGGSRTGASAPPPPSPTTSLSATPTTSPPTSQPVSGGDTTGSKAATAGVQVHEQLDPATLSAPRKAATGAPVTNDLDSMERELAALNARAQYLDAQAQALRARAHAR
jgi:hypothetical protein